MLPSLPGQRPSARPSCSSIATGSNSSKGEQNSCLLCSDTATPHSWPFEERCSLLSLPTEILVRIITFLPAYEKLCMRLTCQRLYSICSDPSIWGTIDYRCYSQSPRELKALKTESQLGHPNHQMSTHMCTPYGKNQTQKNHKDGTSPK